MTTISVTGVREVYRPRVPWLRASILALLAFLGIFSLVAMRSERVDRPQCGGFAIGVSAIGGCDGIGGNVHQP
jgi:hypothetical protein